ncbi:MAG: hypothetical protein K5656_01400 [Lachnospiraceae bacterium]|nr:hypothetical protein [Lachnospiraceae bacterium]
MYYETIYVAGKTIEVYKSVDRLTGPQSRGPTLKRTPEEIRDNNDRQARRKLTRLLNANFADGDLFLTLTYREAASTDEAIKEVKKFIRNLKGRYERRGSPLKWVLVTEYENKRVHHHLVINNPDGFNAYKQVTACWKSGVVKSEALYGNGQYKRLAEYLVKETEKTVAKGETKQRWTCSRNLIRPKPKVRKVRAKRWLKDPKPKKGYIIDQDSVVNGTNGYTGHEYQCYTMIECPKRE